MRTLKKTLALVLVVAMVLSMGVMGVNADFTDVEMDNPYYEAITVLTALGILDGMTETTFAPEGTLNRAQAAKIITYVKLGAVNAEKISAASGQRFDDVAVGENGHWAAAYIDYCANMGIINGVGENKFDPEGMLTTAAFTKMLLVAVGYEGEYTGDSWAINVAADAVTNDLDHDDIVISNSIYISRAEAAQLALQAIQAVPPGGEASYEVANSSLTFATLTEAVLYAQALTGGLAANPITTVSEDSLASKVFKMVEETTTADDWGRPGTVYTYGSDKDTVKFPAEADMMITEAYEASDASDVAEMLEDADMKFGATAPALYVNGAMVVNYGVANVADLIALTGNGVCVELFTTDDVITTVVVTMTAYGKLDTKDVKATSSKGAYTEYSLPAVSSVTDDAAVPAAIEMDGVMFTTVVDEDKDKDTVVITGTVEDDDMVLYTPLFSGNMELTLGTPPGAELDGTLKKIYIEEVTEMVEGEFERWADKGAYKSTYRIDGTDYRMSTAFGADVPSTVAGGDLGKDVEWYVDNHGYLLGTAKEGTSGVDYVMVLDFQKVSVLDGSQIKDEYRAVIVDEAGAVSTVVTAADYTAMDEGKVYTYTGDEKKTFTVVPAANADVNAFGSITKGTAELVAGAAYATNSTIFVKANYDDETPPAVDGTVTIYTGINNVPSYTADTAFYAVTEDGTVASVVFIYDKVDADSNSEFIYVTDVVYNTADGVTYETIVNGEPGTISVTAATAYIAEGMYSKLKITGNTIAVPADKVAADELEFDDNDDGAVETTATMIKNNNGVLTMNEGEFVGTVADSTPVYTIDESANSVENGTAADLDVDNAKFIYIDFDAAGGAADAIYIVVA